MPKTTGVHHVGLTVSRLEESAAFFTKVLGWHEVKRREDYPAIFFSDGHTMITLWSVKQQPVVMFDKNRNVGLHHIALKVGSELELNMLHETMKTNDVPVEFAPEMLGSGPAKHMMRYDPSGIRVELIWPGN